MSSGPTYSSTFPSPHANKATRDNKKVEENRGILRWRGPLLPFLSPSVASTLAKRLLTPSAGTSCSTAAQAPRNVQATYTASQDPQTLRDLCAAWSRDPRVRQLCKPLCVRTRWPLKTGHTCSNVSSHKISPGLSSLLSLPEQVISLSYLPFPP